ncbi:histidine phosphatase family protein [Nocardiopsis ansamitocini]|uniref:Phosphatase n=1 Tax=Nocardiopsis ansamitocini TaxID=1670832 RepID=A0A9W6UL34_9ACTN|nr:histidine phosphatase family protein [Nocardiopsis ansamitocini]GLU50327.1 phosphatase [Nocardiopsis ansamitocini]
MAELVLVRHGQTEWSREGRHTGRTDVPLDERGEWQARAVAPLLNDRRVALALTSPLRRATRTALLAGLVDARPDADLMEWDYGGYEGITTARIQEDRPGWDLWADGVVPGDGQHPGETVDEVGARADRVLAAVADRLGDPSGGDVVVVAHGHLLRVLAVRRLGLPACAGSMFALATATLSSIGVEHGRPVVTAWNTRPPAPSESTP